MPKHTTIEIKNKVHHRVTNCKFTSCQINGRWVAYKDDDLDFQAVGETRAEAIGNLIIGKLTETKVA